MILLLDLLSGLLLVLAGFASIWLLRSSFQHLSLLARALRAKREGFEQLRPGLVALRGRVAPIDELTSSETGRRGVYLAYTADRWQKTAAMGGLSGHWIRAEADEEAAPFELNDGHHSVLVEPGQARVTVDQTVSRVMQPDGTVVSYREAMIEEGADLLVLGEASEAGGFDPSSTYRGHSFRTVVTAGARGDLRIGPPGSLLRALMLAAASRVLGCSAALVAFVWLAGVLSR